MTSDKAEADFIRTLVERVPEFKDVADDDTNYYGEVLPHIVMGSFTRWLVAQHRRAVDGDEVAAEVVKRALGFLDTAVADSGQPAAQDLIAVSFLENLYQHGKEREGLRNELGPYLRMRLERSDRPLQG
jgi:hypothetical protein